MPEKSSNRIGKGTRNMSVNAHKKLAEFIKIEAWERGVTVSKFFQMQVRNGIAFENFVTELHKKVDELRFDQNEMNPRISEHLFDIAMKMRKALRKTDSYLFGDRN